MLPALRREKIMQEHEHINNKIASDYLDSNEQLFQDPIKSGQLKQGITPEVITKALMTIGMKQDKMIEQLFKELRELKKSIR